MNLNDRISKIIEYSQLSASEFADEIDVQRSNISHITSGRNKPSLDFLIKIKNRFPELQWNWLIEGNGEMLISNEVQSSPFEISKEIKTTTSIPDLFSLLDDDNFGITESEDKVQKETVRESNIPKPNTIPEKISDSQRLENTEIVKNLQNTDNQGNKIKRIVLFFENGKFESFEP